MSLAELLVFGIVWGGLMSYFLMPLDDKISLEGTFSHVFIVSLKKLFFHKKAIFAFVLLVITVMSIWYYSLSAEEYDKLHGITGESADPHEQAIIYTISTIVYATLLYLFLAVRWTVRSVKAAK